MALVLLRHFFDSTEAAIARAKLGSEGVESYLFDHESQWDPFGAIRGVRLMVAEQDLESARAVLDDAGEKAGP